MYGYEYVYINVYKAVIYLRLRCLSDISSFGLRPQVYISLNYFEEVTPFSTSKTAWR